MKTVIGVVGEISGGKATFVQELIALAGADKVSSVVFSDALKDTLLLWGAELKRDNFHALAEYLNTPKSPVNLSDIVKHRIINSPTQIVAADGMRWLEDEKMIRSFEHNLVVYVTASIEARYARLKQRQEKKGENMMSFEDFVYQQEHVINERWIAEIGARADVTITNESDLESLRKQTQDFYNSHLKPLLEL